MFWESVISGSKVLLYWQTYVAGLEYLAVFFAPMMLVGYLVEKNEKMSGAIGCLSMFLIPLLQVAAMAIFVLTMAPIILGLSIEAAWSFPWEVIYFSPFSFLKLVGLLAVSAIVLAFIPILGQLQSLQTLVLGGIALTFVIGILKSVYPGLAEIKIDLIPSFGFTLGLLVVGGIMSAVGLVVAGLVSASFSRFGEEMGAIFIFPIAAIFGFIPLFMYGAWLGSQITVGM